MSSRESWDPSAIERLRRVGGDELAVRIISFFLETTPQRIAAMREGEDRNDPELIEQIAHALKSSAGNVGASVLLVLSGELEQRARAQEAQVAELLGEVEGAFEVVRGSLAGRLEELSR